MRRSILALVVLIAGCGGSTGPDPSDRCIEYVDTYAQRADGCDLWDYDLAVQLLLDYSFGGSCDNVVKIQEPDDLDTCQDWIQSASCSELFEAPGLPDLCFYHFCLMDGSCV
jgi:hypothetical protein